MSRHRFCLPAPSPAVPAAGAFVMIPVALLPAVSTQQRAWQQAVYEWAYAEAQAVVQPSLPERDLLGVWN